MKRRVERDSLGEVEVPAEALWGAVTERAKRNFQISGITMPRRFIGALGAVKLACAEANMELGVLPRDVGEAIVRAAAEVMDGRLDEHFPLDIFQTGSGTSTNMNANEVIANRAIEILGLEKGSKAVHPNDHVNAGQSSNDVIPTAMHVSAAEAVEEELLPSLEMLREALEEKAEELKDVVKTGRTHLMDAAPTTLGREFTVYAAQVRRGIERIRCTMPRLLELPIGGTAVGT
ncbi:MAG: aspartate ammonia-lyase, partial [Methanobacteriota archaeon]